MREDCRGGSIRVSAEDLRGYPLTFSFFAVAITEPPASIYNHLVRWSSSAHQKVLTVRSAQEKRLNTYILHMRSWLTTIQHGPKYRYVTHSFTDCRFPKALFFGAMSPMNYGRAVVAVRTRRSSSLHDLRGPAFAVVVSFVVSFVETSVLCANAGQVVVRGSDIDT